MITSLKSQAEVHVSFSTQTVKELNRKEMKNKFALKLMTSMTEENVFSSSPARAIPAQVITLATNIKINRNVFIICYRLAGELIKLFRG